MFYLISCYYVLESEDDMRQTYKRHAHGTIEDRRLNWDEVRMQYTRVVNDIPASYKKIAVVELQERGTYESGLMDVYRAKDGSLRFSIYHDGNFCPYIGKLFI